MNPILLKRLAEIEEKFAPDGSKNGVVFLPLKGETDEEYDARVERWYAGEKVEGQDKLYTGLEAGVGKVIFVQSTCPDAA